MSSDKNVGCMVVSLGQSICENTFLNTLLDKTSLGLLERNIVFIF